MPRHRCLRPVLLINQTAEHAALHVRDDASFCEPSGYGFPQQGIVSHRTVKPDPGLSEPLCI